MKEMLLKKAKEEYWNVVYELGYDSYYDEVSDKAREQIEALASCCVDSCWQIVPEEQEEEAIELVTRYLLGAFYEGQGQAWADE